MGTTSTATVTRTELIQMALRRLGESNANATELAQAVIALNSLIKTLDIEGRHLWAINNTISTFTTVAAQQSYTTGSGASDISTNILELEEVYIVRSSSDHEPIAIIDKERSITTPYKQDSGEPLEVFLQTAPTLAAQKLWLFPIPSAAYTIGYYFRRRLYDFTGASDNPDMPGEWIWLLTKGLAAALAPEYGVTLPERNDLRLEYQEELRRVVGGGQEGAPTHIINTYYY